MTWSGRSLWTWTLTARESPATRTDSPSFSSFVAQPIDVERLVPGLEQEHRLVAEALIGVDRGSGVAGRRAAQPPRCGPAARDTMN